MRIVEGDGSKVAYVQADDLVKLVGVLTGRYKMSLYTIQLIFVFKNREKQLQKIEFH